MDGDRARFQKIEIEGFRGFRDLQQISLDASAIVAVGSNGTGKTSFFDAFQWLLLGDLPRLKDFAARRSGDYVVNLWSSSGVATVRAELQVGSRRVYVSRVGTASSSQLELNDEGKSLYGETAQQYLGTILLVRNGASLVESFLTSGLLQQDILREAIESDPKDRYARLTQLLGLEALPSFREAARSTSSELSKEAAERRTALDRIEEQLLEAQQELERLIASVAETFEVQELHNELTAELAEQAADLSILGGLQLDTNKLSRLGADARRVRERATDLITIRRRLISEGIAQDGPSPEEIALTSQQVERLASNLEMAETDLRNVTEKLQEAERVSSRLADLAERALPLLDTHCPVCQQTINRDHVRQHLELLLDQEDSEILVLRSSVERMTIRRDSVAEEWRKAAEAHETLLSERAEFLRLAGEQQEWMAICEDLAGGIGSLQPVDAKGVRSGSEAAIEGVRRAATEVERIAREAVAALAVPELSGRIENQRTRVAQLASNAELLRGEVAAASRRAEEGRALVRATTQAITNVTKRRFEKLAPLVAEIYSRLDPHPAFTHLDYALDVYYQRPVANPVVTDQETGVTADPLLIFSSSQANVVALTFFLAMSWSAGAHSLPFLLLDDPLQAMDDINALGFADLCRHIRRARQLVVSTHDRRLGGLLERKLAPRAAGEQTRVLRFVGWDRSGPQIEQEIIEPQLEIAERRVLAGVA